MYTRKDPPLYSIGRPGSCAAMMWPSISVPVNSSGLLLTATWILAVVKPTDVSVDSGVTETEEVRDAGSTAQDASSGSAPAGPTRTRSTSSRKAVICMIPLPERISIPLVNGREAVTRSNRTKPDCCLASPAEFACDVLTKTANTTNRKRPAFCTQHLKGANSVVVQKHKPLVT